jgi:cell division protein FtsL
MIKYMSFMMREKTVFSLIFIAIATCACLSVFFHQQTVDAQSQTRELKNQIAQYGNATDQLNYYQNLTETLQHQLDINQAQIANLQNLTETLQDQANSLQTQINNLQNATCNATISALTVEPWDVEYGTPYFKDFNISIQNTGTVDAGGFTVRFTLEGNTSSIDQYYFSISPKQLGVFHVQETKTLQARMITGYVEVKQALSECNLVVQLVLDDAVLDERIQPIGP